MMNLIDIFIFIVLSVEMCDARIPGVGKSALDRSGMQIKIDVEL